MKDSVAKTANAVDNRFMRTALGLARRGLGSVWPNPAVGCVLVDCTEPARPMMVGRGWTQPGGRPHAEAEALVRAGAMAKGCTAYVTLEPCAHHGRTPPCADALVGAGVARCVISTEDPDPRVAGNGLARIRAAGIPITMGVLAAEAAELNAGFFSRIVLGRPLIALKTATSLDGRIAAAGGASRWITGEQARAQGHRLRACYDALMVGASTVVADDPLLTCRLPGLSERSPVRVVLDAGLTISPNCQLVRTAREHPLWIVATEAAPARPRARLEQAGAVIVDVAADGQGRCDLQETLAALGRLGLTRVLVEGGGSLSGALLQADLIDRLIWFRAPTVMGADAQSAFWPLGLATPGQAPRFVLIDRAEADGDWVETYARKEVPCSPAS